MKRRVKQRESKSKVGSQIPGPRGFGFSIKRTRSKNRVVMPLGCSSCGG